MTDLINLYRQAEDYFFRGISLKCMDLDDGVHAYMTGGAELNFIYITKNTNALDKILNGLSPEKQISFNGCGFR